MEFNHLPDLLNTGFTIVEIGLFYGGEHLGAKICNFLTCFDKITSRFLIIYCLPNSFFSLVLIVQAPIGSLQRSMKIYDLKKVMCIQGL